MVLIFNLWDRSYSWTFYLWVQDKAMNSAFSHLFFNWRSSCVVLVFGDHWNRNTLFSCIYYPSRTFHWRHQMVLTFPFILLDSFKTVLCDWGQLHSFALYLWPSQLIVKDPWSGYICRSLKTHLHSLYDPCDVLLLLFHCKF